MGMTIVMIMMALAWVLMTLAYRRAQKRANDLEQRLSKEARIHRGYVQHLKNHIPADKKYLVLDILQYRRQWAIAEGDSDGE